jgi:hypothetical protein
MARRQQSFFSGKNKHFLQILVLCLILLGLFAGVVIVSNKNAVLKRSSASSTCAKWNQSCNSLNCCQGLAGKYDSSFQNCTCRLSPSQCDENSGYYHDGHVQCSSDKTSLQKCVAGKLIQTKTCHLSVSPNPDLAYLTTGDPCRGGGDLDSAYCANDSGWGMEGNCGTPPVIITTAGTCPDGTVLNVWKNGDCTKTTDVCPACIPSYAKCSTSGTKCCRGTCTLSSSGYYSCP